MNVDTDLEKLLLISTVQYDRKRLIFAKVLAEESHLRQELLRLTNLDQTVEGDATSISGMRVVGADVLWQGWLSRTKSALNVQLARVLAIKAHEQDKVRKSFGKVVALRKLVEEEQKQRHKTAAQTALAFAIDHALR